MHGSLFSFAAGGGSEPRLFYRPVETKVKIAGGRNELLVGQRRESLRPKTLTFERFYSKPRFRSRITRYMDMSESAAIINSFLFHLAQHC